MKTTVKLLIQCLLLSSICYGFSSCRLDGETLVEGQIVDRHTGKPVGNGYVVVFGASGGGYSYSSSYGYVAEGKTDANGKFGFTFEGNGDMVLRGFTDLGYYSDWEEGAVKLKNGRNNKDLNVKMIAPAWVKVKLVNVPPMEISPMIYVWNFSPDEKGEISVELPYLKNDTTFVKGIMTYWEQGISWSIRAKDGADTKYSTRVYAASLDTVEVRIEY